MSKFVRLVRPNKLAVRAPRVQIDLVVESKTLGTSAAYSMATEDVSRSGLLLVWERDSKMPFIVNTLIEMTIDPKGSCLSKPVSCLGKVVRRDTESDGLTGHHARFGVQIVQIDPGDQQNWESCLNELERKFGISTSDKAVIAS